MRDRPRRDDPLPERQKHDPGGSRSKPGKQAATFHAIGARGAAAIIIICAKRAASLA